MDIDETRYYREKDGNILKLDIIRDLDPMNPRMDWDNIATMVCFHGRYTLGDVRTLPYGKTDVIPHTNVRYDNSADGANAFAEWAKKELDAGNIVIASLELYDHSGITMRVHRWGHEAFGTGRTGWDSGIVGWCFVTKDRAFEELALKDGADWTAVAKECIMAEVEIYDDYLTNEVYRFDLYRLSPRAANGTAPVDLQSAEWDEIDSCGGFYGSDHEKNGVLECIPEGAVQITEDDLTALMKETATTCTATDNTGTELNAADMLQDIKWNCEHCTARQQYERRKAGGNPCRGCRLRKYGYGGEA